MKINKTKTLVSVMFAIFIGWLIISLGASEARNKALAKENIELEQQAELSEIEIIQIDLDRNREQRKDIQSRIDSLLEQKKQLSIDADSLKDKANDLLGF